jgi:hypothetical protein
LGLDGSVWVEEESIEAGSEVVPRSVLHEGVDVGLVR